MAKVNVSKTGIMNGHKDCVYALAHSPQPSIFFSGAGDGMVVKWDLENMDQGELIAKVPNSVYALDYLSEPDLLVVGHNYEGVHLIDWKQKKEIASLKCTSGAIFDIKSYGDQLFVGDSEGTLTVIDWKAWKIIYTHKLSQKSLRTIAIDQRRGELALGFSDHVIRIMTLDPFEVKQELTNHSNSVFSVTFDPSNDILFSGGRDAHLLAWDASRNYQLRDDIIAHMYAINNITFSPDGKHFVTCSMDKSIKVWDAQTISLLKVIDKARHAGHGTSVNRTLWLRDTLVSASDDRTISAWNLEFNY
jgi:WD40 repeat protein